MDPIEFRKVFMDEQEPYQEFLQVVPMNIVSRKQANGDHVILSPYSMELLFRKTVQQPMKFLISSSKHHTYCSVEEFSAPVGVCIIPQWMMDELDVSPRDYVRIESISLPKGKSASFRLYDEELFSVPNIKRLLETELIHHVVLAEGSSIPITYNDDTYYIDIVHCEPAPVIDINNVNLEIDFVGAEYESEEEEEHTVSPTTDGRPAKVTYTSAAEQRAKRLAYLNGKRCNVC